MPNFKIQSKTVAEKRLGTAFGEKPCIWGVKNSGTAKIWADKSFEIGQNLIVLEKI